MDWTPVPPGTPAAAALVMRGPEHDVVVDAAHQFVCHLLRCFHLAFTKPIVAPGAAGSRLIQYSTLLGVHGGHLYTEDNGVLMQSTSQVVILPARVEASRARYVAEGACLSKEYSRFTECVTEASNESNVLSASFVRVHSTTANPLPAIEQFFCCRFTYLRVHLSSCDGKFLVQKTELTRRRVAATSVRVTMSRNSPNYRTIDGRATRTKRTDRDDRRGAGRG